MTSQEGLINPKTVFQWINKYDAVPFARIPLNAGLSATTKWLADCLESIDFRNKCYLCIISFAVGWHWSEVEAVDPEEWILDLLLRTDVDDFMVLSHNQTSFLGFVEDEDEYLIFVSQNILSRDLAPN